MLPAVLALLLAATLLTGSLLGGTLTLFGLAIIQFNFGGNFAVLGDGLWNIFNSFALTALPMFILLGEILSHTGISRRIYASVAPLFSRLPGQLMQTNIGACTLFAAICGSSQATAAVVGSISFQELTRRGYNPRRVAGSIAAGGTLGILIPPSLPLLIYGWWQDVSVGSLFVAGIVPGLMMAALFMTFIGVHALRHPQDFPPREAPMALWRAVLASAGAWPFLVLVFAILGTLVLGLATATESAGLGCATALILAALYRQLSWAVLWRAVMGTVTIFSTIAFVIVGATVLAQALALAGIPQALTKLVASSGVPREVVLLAVYLLYLVLGCFLAALDMLLITLPFTFPLMIGLGYDPVWFGIALVLLIEIGMLTPPVGMNLFVLTAVGRGVVTLSDVAWGAVPYWIILIGGLALVTLFPDIVLFLPRLLVS